MAALNFPDPNTTQTYTEAGITWTWNATLGVWSSELEGSADKFLSKVNDDTAAGAITFEKQTTHQNGITTSTISGGGTNLSLYTFNSIDCYTNDTLFSQIGRVGSNVVSAFDTKLFTFSVSNSPKDAIQGYVAALDGQSANSSGVDYSGYTDAIGFKCVFPRDNATTTTDPTTAMIGYLVAPYNSADEKDTAITYYGFRSKLNRSQNYNFYAEGTAPNYFEGYSTFKNGIFYNGASYNGYITSRSDWDKDTTIDGTQAGIYLGVNTVTGIGNSSAGAKFGNTSTSNWTKAISFVNGSSNNCGLIECKKDVAPRFATNSDRRLKSNIVDAESMLPKFEALQVRRFTIDNGYGPTDNVLGFVADELQQVFADAVNGTPNEMVTQGNVLNSEGTVVDTEVEDPATSGYTLEAGQTFVSTMAAVPKYQTVAEGALIVPMAKAIQELIALNTALTTRIEALETQVGGS